MTACRCGGHGIHYIEIVKAEVLIHWIECDTCHNWTAEARSEPAAMQNWFDTMNGIIRPRRHRTWSPEF